MRPGALPISLLAAALLACAGEEARSGGRWRAIRARTPGFWPSAGGSGRPAGATRPLLELFADSAPASYRDDVARVRAVLRAS